MKLDPFKSNSPRYVRSRYKKSSISVKFFILLPNAFNVTFRGVSSFGTNLFAGESSTPSLLTKRFLKRLSVKISNLFIVLMVMAYGLPVIVGLEEK